MITTQETIDMLNYVLYTNFADFPDGHRPRWPKFKSIYPTMIGFGPLLSTPNIRGACWLRIQHSVNSKLGLKIVGRIDVFEEVGMGADGYLPNVLIYFTDNYRHD